MNFAALIVGIVFLVIVMHGTDNRWPLAALIPMIIIANAALNVAALSLYFDSKPDAYKVSGSGEESVNPFVKLINSWRGKKQVQPAPMHPPLNRQGAQKLDVQINQVAPEPAPAPPADPPAVPMSAKRRFSTAISRVIHTPITSIPELANALKNPSTNQEFLAYLPKEFATENLLFYNILNKLETTSSPQDRIVILKTILSEYLTTGKENTANLEDKLMVKLREEIQSIIDEGANDLSKRTYRDQAVIEVLKMLKDPYNRWVKKGNADVKPTQVVPS